MNQNTTDIVNCWERVQAKKENRHVTIDDAMLEYIAKTYAEYSFQLPSWNMHNLYPRGGWTFAANQIVSNCFNFCFNIFDEPDRKYQVAIRNAREPYRGSMAMQRKIYQHFTESIIQAHDLAPHVESVATMERFFADLTPIPFPELRYDCGRGLVNNLNYFFYGSTLNLLESAIERDGNEITFRAFNKGDGLVELLVNKFPETYGSDVQKLGGETLRFNKRAQLVALIIHGRALSKDSKLPIFSDTEEIGPIADYEVPRALRAFGILVYDKELSSFVNGWQPIEKDSRREVEIRAATVAVCYRMLTQINTIREEKTLTPIHIGHLDHWLWQTGRQTSGRPHLVRTTSY